MPSSPPFLPAGTSTLANWVSEAQTMIDQTFGSSPESITWWQTSLRAVVIFLYGIIIIRLGYRRVFGQSTDFDIVVAVLIGSALSRALTGNAHLLPTFAATTVLVILHAALARAACRWHKLSWLAKGAEVRMVEGGRMDRQAMRRCGITEGDLLEAARARGTEDLSRIDVAVLERNGRISVILKQQR